MPHVFRHAALAYDRAASYIGLLNRTNPNIMTFVLYGVLYESCYNIYRPLAVKFLERVGGNAFHVALFYSLPGLMAAISLLPGSFILSRLPLKKNVTSVLFLISRFLILCLAVVPFLSEGARPWAFVILIGALNLPEALAQTSLQGFLGNVFSGQERAKAIALRNKFGNMFILLATLSTGVVITAFPKTDAQRIVFYQVFFVLAFLVGLLEILVFRRFREEAPPASVKSGMTVNAVKNIFKDKKFMTFMATTITVQFMWQIGWPLCSIYYIEQLRSTEIWFSLYTVAAGLAAFFTVGYWGKAINRYGNPNTLFAASLWTAMNMLIMIMIPTPFLMVLANIFMGISTVGLNTALLNGVLQSTPDKNRIVYLGAYNTMVNLSLFLSPLLASALVGAFGVVTAMKINFVLRLVSVGILYVTTIYKKKEPKTAS